MRPPPSPCKNSKNENCTHSLYRLMGCTLSHPKKKTKKNVDMGYTFCHTLTAPRSGLCLHLRAKYWRNVMTRQCTHIHAPGRRGSNQKLPTRERETNNQRRCQKNTKKQSSQQLMPVDELGHREEHEGRDENSGSYTRVRHHHDDDE